jgi:molybdate transport system substrate-binding protein
MIVRAALIGAVAVTMAMPADAAEINVVAAGAVRGIIRGMIDDYSKETGHKFNFIVGPTGQLRDALSSGKPVDLVIVAAPLLAELDSAGKIAAGSRVDLGRVGLGVVVREGTPSPDISTPEA